MDCGQNQQKCNMEFMLAYGACSEDDYPNIDDRVACMSTYWDSDCYDCLCDFVTVTGGSCP